MSTVPSYPTVDPVLEDDIIYIIRGLGDDRDKKATVAQIGLAGHTSLDLESATAVAPTDTMFLVQGTGADKDVMATVGDVASAGLPTAVAGLAAPGTLAPTQTVPLLQGADLRQVTIAALVDTAAAGVETGADYSTSHVLAAEGTSMVKYEMRTFQGQGVDIAKNTTNPPVWTGAATSAWADTVSAGHIRLLRHKSAIGQSSGAYTLDIMVRFAAVSGASSDTAFVVLRIPEAAFPAGWFDDIADLTTLGAFNCRTTARVQKSDAAGYTETEEVVSIEPTGSAIEFSVVGLRWQTLMPDNAADAYLHISCNLLPDFPATLP